MQEADFLDQNVSSQLLAAHAIKSECRDMASVCFMLPASRSVDGVKVENDCNLLPPSYQKHQSFLPGLFFAQKQFFKKTMHMLLWKYSNNVNWTFIQDFSVLFIIF